MPTWERIRDALLPWLVAAIIVLLAGLAGGLD